MKNVNARIFAVILLLTSGFGYMSWGKGNNAFIFQLEAEVFSKALSEPLIMVHFLIFLPLFGQILLLIAALQKQPVRKLIVIGFFAIAILFLLIAFVGVINRDIKMLASTIPFLGTGIFAITRFRKWRVQPLTS